MQICSCNACGKPVLSCYLRGMDLAKKLRTISSIDPRWAYKFLRKRTGHYVSYMFSRLSGRTYWEVPIEGVNVRLVFFTPYHHRIAHLLSQNLHEAKVLSEWARECRGHRIIYDIGGMTGIFGLAAAK